MKKTWLFLLASLLATSAIVPGEAAVVMIGGPGIVIEHRHPVRAVIVDGNGVKYEQTVYYDSGIGGVDINANFAGPNASIYFPEYNTNYLWYNGYWVDQAGFYWNGSSRVYIDHPHWHDHWAVYWGGCGGGWHHHPEVSVHVHETIYEHGHHHH